MASRAGHGTQGEGELPGGERLESRLPKALSVSLVARPHQVASFKSFLTLFRSRDPVCLPPAAPSVLSGAGHREEARRERTDQAPPRSTLLHLSRDAEGGAGEAGGGLPRAAERRQSPESSPRPPRPGSPASQLELQQPSLSRAGETYFDTPFCCWRPV